MMRMNADGAANILMLPAKLHHFLRIGQIGPDKVEQVVFEVMRELESRGVL